MKGKLYWTLALAGLVLVGCKSAAVNPSVHLFDLAQQSVVSHEEAVQRLGLARIVLVGEHHNNADHHQAQLEVIQSLFKSGRKVAVGMEMFRRQSQASLDQWVGGQISEAQFMPIYLENWNYGWDLYGPIFKYAREKQIPMVGLNVSRKITGQVAYHGFASLDEDQRGLLEGITCNVTQQYRDFIRKAYGAHGHGKMNFNRFCEAQLVWDTAMAKHAVDYLERHPDDVMVVIAGSGHARKLGIPTQLEKITPWAYAVVLPETEGIFDAKRLTVEDADYILLSK